MSEHAEKAAADDVGSSVFGYVTDAFADANVSSALNDAETAYFFYNNHPYVGSAVNIIASAIVADGFDIIDPTREDDKDATDADPRTKALWTLFNSINEEQTLLDMVEEIAMDMDVVGRAYAHKLRLPNAACVGLERIDPRTMSAVLAADGTKIARFVQKIKVNGALRTKTFPVEDIIYFKRPGGADLLGGQSLIQQLDNTLAVDFGSRKSNAARFRNGPRAGMVLVADTSGGAKLSKDDATRVDTMLKDRAGADNAHRPMMLTGPFTPYFPKSEDDEEFTKGLDRSRQEVCAVFHVPESKLMTTEGTLGGNGKEQDDQTFHEECVMPRCRRIYSTLTRELLLKEFKISDLQIVPKSKYAIRVSSIEDAKNLLSAGGSINDARDLIGLPKSADTTVELDVPYVASTVVKASAEQMDLPLNEVGQTAEKGFRTNAKAQADLSRRLHGLVDSETARLSTAWDAASARIKALSERNHFTVMQAIGDLRLVNRDAYISAATAGMNAVPARKASSTVTVSADDIADEWIAHVQPYADAALDRAGQAILAELQADDTASALDDKLNALRSSITRYAEPVWGTGQQGYSAALDANDVLVVWELGADDDHCDDCVEIADGSPYARGDLPSYPKLGETACRDRCYCSIVADPETFSAAFGA